MMLIDLWEKICCKGEKMRCREPKSFAVRKNVNLGRMQRLVKRPVEIYPSPVRPNHREERINAGDKKITLQLAIGK